MSLPMLGVDELSYDSRCDSRFVHNLDLVSIHTALL